MHPLFVGLEPLLAALEPASAQGNVRLIGGTVRAHVRHDPTTHTDRDLATTLLPEDVLTRCLAARLPAQGTGLRWGTVTVQVGGRSVEITTLRTETYTPGSRYPTVSFITDWAQDATRRDFTCNAISLAPDGQLYDPFNGTQDLRHGLIRFIGTPALRLAEDPLRLLRFFRFCGHYGLGGLTPEVSAALKAATPALARVSLTRQRQEWQKLKATPQAPSVLAEMAALGIFPPT